MKNDKKYPLGKKERLNRTIMIFCGVIGVLTGGIFAIANDTGVENGSAYDLFTNQGAIPVSVAIAFTLVWCVIMPAVAWIWHRKAIDEQEAAAYRDGGYYSAYAFIIITPAWWMLWRGGILPQPHGVGIFLAFNAIWLFVWFWKKYR